MTTIKDPKAMTTKDPRWLTWYVQQRRFERIKHGGYTAPSLVLSFENEAYQMGAQNTPPDYRSYSDLITFTRASGGGITNAAGQFEWVGNNVPRITYDPVTLKRLGQLIEEQRTNLLLQSANIASATWAKAVGVAISTDGQLAPDGTLMPLVTLSGTTNHNINQVLAAPLTSGQTYTLTLYVKAKSSPFAIQLAYYDGSTSLASTQITPVAGGTQRIDFTFTPAATAVSPQIRLIGFGNGLDGAKVYIWGAQLEPGSSPSSYIPTTTAQVTRAADVCSVNTLSPWYNPLEGSLVLKAISSPSQPTPISETYAALRGASINDRIEIAKATAQTNLAGAVVRAGALQANLNGATLPPNTAFGAAISYRDDSFAFSLNGGTVVTDNSGLVPVVTVLNIGSRSSANQCNGIISSIIYYPRVIDVQQASA